LCRRSPHAEPLDETSARFAAEGETNRTLNVAQTDRPASVTAGEPLGALGEDTLRAPPVDTGV